MTEPHLFIIYGGTGDLARRKLLPSLYSVLAAQGGSSNSVVLGVSSADLGNDEYRKFADDALSAAGIDDTWANGRVQFQRIDRDAPDLSSLADRIAAIESERNLPGHRVFYLALPPVAFPGVIASISAAGLNRSPGWTRLVVEKPFGRDLQSASDLNRLLHQHFGEEQIYRIDHYLGKETVRNLLAFRFANLLFETSWNRDRVDAVEITVAESLGIGLRGGYFDNAGIIRDMVQNHLTQLLSLVAMEAPHSFEAEAIRDEKVQLLSSIREIDLDQVVLGQYGPGTADGENLPGYQQEESVPVDSRTPTYVSLKLEIDNWRWQGVPFYLRTGKGMPRKTSHIVIRFRPPPICLFHGRKDTCEAHQNVIKLSLQPNEGFELHFDVKTPGEALHLANEQLRFMYAEQFGPLPEAYTTLISDVLAGDQTLFVRADEVETSWRLFDPVIEAAATSLPVEAYDAGSWGPPNRHMPIAWAQGPIRAETTTDPR